MKTMDIKNFSWFEGDDDVLFVYDTVRGYYMVTVTYVVFSATSFASAGHDFNNVTIKDMELIKRIASHFGTRFNNYGRATSYYDKDKGARKPVKKDDYKLRNRLESQFND